MIKHFTFSTIDMYFYRWGIRDVEDCCSGAQCLVRQGKADGEKLCIDGGSAGGFTTLACLTFTDVFKAGHFKLIDILTLNQPKPLKFWLIWD